MPKKDPNEQFLRDIPQEEIDLAVRTDACSVLRERISETVDRWFMENIHGTVVGQNTESYNHVYQSMPVLKSLLEAALKE